jgi:hypothetical protein
MKNGNQNEPQVIVVEVIEEVVAEDGPSATANFSAGTEEMCEAHAG